MITSKAIPICRSPFQGESSSSLSPSPRSVGTLGSYSSSPRRKPTVAMAYQDPHKTLGVARGGSKHEIKKAYRRLALQYHPDVCEGNHCSITFQRINFAYETLLNATTQQFGDLLSDNLEGFAGAGNDSWEDWEEWMGWEGAATRDYSDHNNFAT